MSSPFSGRWPPIAPPPPPGKSPADIAEGARQLLDYLQARGYCKEFLLSDFTPDKDGGLVFKSLVREPVNLEVTSSLVRSNIDFLPRYDQRILQAYFADRGFDSTFADVLADGMSGRAASRSGLQQTGVRTEWRLRPDPDAGL